MPSPELAGAIASLLNGDQERILSLASSLRGPNRTIESKVTGNSMGRGLPPGSHIRIELSKGHEYTVGQVVAFVGGERVVVHRLVHQAGDYVLTRGDAVLTPDRPVRRDQILGPVTAVSRDGAWQDLPPPLRRSVLGRAFAPVLLTLARALLLFGPGVTGTAMRMLHALEGRAQLTLGRLLSSPR